MLDINEVPWYWREHPGRTVAFTIIEMLLVMALLMTLAAIVMPMYSTYVDEARMLRAMTEVHTIETFIERYERNHGDLPASLDALEDEMQDDPWGTPYQYLKIRGEEIKGKAPQGARRDKFLVPLNTDYDLYSMGKDGDSRPPLTAKVSRDDIVRAADGEYVGLASGY